MEQVKIAAINKHKEELSKQLMELTGEGCSGHKMDQEALLQQLQNALCTKGDMDPQKAMLRADPQCMTEASLAAEETG